LAGTEHRVHCSGVTAMRAELDDIGERRDPFDVTMLDGAKRRL
jgi:hypothetical protein